MLGLPGDSEVGGGGNPPLCLLHRVSGRHFDLLLRRDSPVAVAAALAREIADVEALEAEAAEAAAPADSFRSSVSWGGANGVSEVSEFAERGL